MWKIRYLWKLPESVNKHWQNLIKPFETSRTHYATKKQRRRPSIHTQFWFISESGRFSTCSNNTNINIIYHTVGEPKPVVKNQNVKLLLDISTLQMTAWLHFSHPFFPTIFHNIFFIYLQPNVNRSVLIINVIYLMLFMILAPLLANSGMPGFGNGELKISTTFVYDNI